ncbi:MAG: carbohydrate ABC transporter permease [Cellulosilyticaceae bacterium]
MNKLKKFFDKYIAYIFLTPYVTLFTLFITLPVIVAIGLSFTNFNSIQFPEFVGLQNYITLFTADTEFTKYVLPNTFKFVIIVGLGGYVLSFVLAWVLAQLPPIPRNIYALIIYSPSMTGGVMISVLWKVIFSGDANGYINAMLLNWGIISEPVQFLSNPDFILNIVMFVSIWSSMGIGFLAMLAGVLNTNAELYEAGSIDGITNRLQEMFYITIPSMKPQMLFGAVMSIVGTFNAGAIGVALTGTNPTPGYSAQLIVNHIDDYGFLRYEMGYAAAISVFLLVLVYLLSKISFRMFSED